MRSMAENYRSADTTRAAIAKLMARGLSQAQIARELGISKANGLFPHANARHPAPGELARRYDWNEISAYYQAGHSMTECRRHFGFSRNAWWDAIRRGVITPRPRLGPIALVRIGAKPAKRHRIQVRLPA